MDDHVVTLHNMNISPIPSNNNNSMPHYYKVRHKGLCKC